jgi:hypothetical protein
MLYAVLNNQEIPVSAFDMRLVEKRIPEFNVTIPAPYLGTTPNDIIFADIGVYRDGNPFISGIVSAYPQPAVYQGQQGFYKLACDGEVGRLYLELAADVQFQDVPISVVISTLLATAQDSNWLLDDITTLQNDNITIDVRDRESLWAQIEQVFKRASVPTFWRYGGMSGGNHLLNIGSFGEQSPTYRAIQGENIIGRPDYKQATRTPILQLRPISGRVGLKPVALSEALGINPGLASDPDYPLDAASESVLNAGLSRGRRLRKRFTDIKTENADNPTTEERQEAALSLYRSARREMVASEPYETLSLDVALPFQPELHNMMYVDTQVRELVYDDYTESAEWVDTLTRQGWYRITGIKYKHKAPYAISDSITETQFMVDTYEVDLTSGSDTDEYDESALVMDKLETNDLQDNTGVIVGVLDSVAVTVTETGQAPDCDYSGPSTGKIFTFGMPSIPSGATQVSASVISTSANVGWAIDQVARISPLQDYQLCVSGPGGVPWTIAHNVTITVLYSFT